MFPVWNETPASVAMQKHILRFRHHQHRISFDVDLVLSKACMNYKRGELEKLSKYFFECCLQGKTENVKKLLKEKKIYVDVCDANGNSPLIGAAVSAMQTLS